MGYDMYWHAPPEADQAEYELARAAAMNYADAHQERPRPPEVQAEVERLFDAMREAEYWYFRLNIWGMSTVRDQLVELGIIQNDYEMPDEVELDWVPPGDRHGVAMHKLCSNDGWHVTPGEITTGLAWAEAHHPNWRMDIEDYALRFCEFMERAAHEGEGFDVH